MLEQLQYMEKIIEMNIIYIYTLVPVLLSISHKQVCSKREAFRCWKLLANNHQTHKFVCVFISFSHYCIFLCRTYTYTNIHFCNAFYCNTQRILQIKKNLSLVALIKYVILCGCMCWDVKHLFSKSCGSITVLSLSLFLCFRVVNNS